MIFFFYILFYLYNNKLWVNTSYILEIFVKLIYKLLLIHLLLVVFLVLLSLLFFYSKRNKKLAKKTKISINYVPFLKKQEINPDVSTDNWDLHKLRLNKFGRSQYKGLTFFINSENRIYYISEEGDKVYC